MIGVGRGRGAFVALTVFLKVDVDRREDVGRGDRGREHAGHERGAGERVGRVLGADIERAQAEVALEAVDLEERLAIGRRDAVRAGRLAIEHIGQALNACGADGQDDLGFALAVDLGDWLGRDPGAGQHLGDRGNVLIGVLGVDGRRADECGLGLGGFDGGLVLGGCARGEHECDDRCGVPAVFHMNPLSVSCGLLSCFPACHASSGKSFLTVSTRSLTWLADSLKSFCSPSSSLNSTIFSTPLEPSSAGTPTKRPLQPNWPSR